MFVIKGKNCRNWILKSCHILLQCFEMFQKVLIFVLKFYFSLLIFILKSNFFIFAIIIRSKTCFIYINDLVIWPVSVPTIWKLHHKLFEVVSTKKMQLFLIYLKYIKLYACFLKLLLF